MAQEVTCPTCGFSVRGDDEGELRRVIRDHAEEKHDTELSDDQVQEMTKSA